MHPFKHISSTQNPLVRQVLLLQEKSRERKKSSLFVLEGKKELFLAQKGGYQLQTVLFCPAFFTEKEVTALQREEPSISQWVSLSPEVYQKVAYRGGTEGILAVAKTREHGLEHLHFKNKSPLILVAEAPEKPGNIGALLRTSDAAALDAVIIANPKTDLYNPNIIRSSVGCLFTTQIALASTSETVAFLKSNSISIYCAALTATKNYLSTDFTKPSAIVVGTEATGLSDPWLQHSDENIIIPMRGHIDSMNVSVSASVLIFEALRQRHVWA